MAAYIDPQQRKLIGQRIQWAREILCPNRAEFGRAIGVDRSTLCKLEDGSRGASLVILGRICHGLRVSMDYLLTGSLSGVHDPAMAKLLQIYHPELTPPMNSRVHGRSPNGAPTRGRPRKDGPHSKLATAKKAAARVLSRSQ